MFEEMINTIIVNWHIIIPFTTSIFVIGWKFLSKKRKEWIKLHFRKYILLKEKPYHSKKYLSNRTEQKNTTYNISNRHNFIIRLGKFSIANPDYRKETENIIKSEHIWDWNFFIEDDTTIQCYEWIEPFFQLSQDGKIKEIKKNTTTELSIIKISKLLMHKAIFEKYNINTNFDDCIIEGTILMDRFFEISSLNNLWNKKLIKIKKIKFYYAGKTKPDKIELFKNKIAKSIVQSIVESYDNDKRLFIPKNKPKNKKNINNLIKYLNDIKRN